MHSWWHPWWQTLDPVSWSLACEAFFYATFPAFALLLRHAGALTATALAGASVLTVLILTRADLHLGVGRTLYSFPAARLPEFVLGVAVARLVLLGRWRGPGLEASVALRHRLLPGLPGRRIVRLRRLHLGRFHLPDPRGRPGRRTRPAQLVAASGPRPTR